MDKVKIKAIFDQVLKNKGFIKKGNTWYSSSNECVVLLNLQHSNFSPLYYVNLASFIRKHDDEEKYPRESICHIRMRTPAIGENGEKYAELLDLEANISDEKRETSLIDMIHDCCLPNLTKLSSIDGIKKLYEEKPSLNFISPYASLGI
jgi:hypothetical protein